MEDNSEVRDKAFHDWKKGMKYKEIAEKYNVSLSAVKSWASRYWNNSKVATKYKKEKRKKSQPANTKLQPKPPPKSRGAPNGNRNASGTHSGAAPGNQNNFKHGVYSRTYWDNLDDEETAMLEDMGFEEEILLQEQIMLLTVRERRLLKSIQKQKEAKGGLALDSVVQRKLDIDGNIIKGSKQTQTETTTKTISTFECIQRLEAELTRVQKAKTKAITDLNRLRLKRREIENEESERLPENEDDNLLEAIKGSADIWDEKNETEDDTG